MEPISVMLIDDNPTFLRATTQFLNAHDDLSVIGTADEGEEALVQVTKLNPRVILVDLAMIGLSGLEVIPRLREAMPNTGIIALTLLNTNNFRQAALRAGADDFVPKATMRTELVPAIRRVIQGEGRGGTVFETTPSNGSKSARRVLAIEDDGHLNRLYRKALGAAGYAVSTAETLERARELLDQERFDVVLCDIHMGDDHGTDLLREYATTLATNGTQVIMVSGQAQYRAMCEELGADFFLEKPVSINTLITILSRFTARQKALD